MKKVALICALVMTVSLIPVFALDQTNNTTSNVPVQNQTKLQKQLKNCTQENCTKQNYSQENCINNCNGVCDEEHKYQHGQKNSAKSTVNAAVQKKYQYGKKNSAKSTVKTGTQKKYKFGYKKTNSSTKTCNYQNCTNN